MANYDSNEYTTQVAASAKAGAMIANAATISGKVRFLQFTVDKGSGALSASDTIRLGFVPTDAGVAVDDDAITGSVNAVANTVGSANLNTSVASVAFSARTLLMVTQVGALAANAKYTINIPLVNSN